jgi:hypothetical protein
MFNVPEALRVPPRRLGCPGRNASAARPHAGLAALLLPLLLLAAGCEHEGPLAPGGSSVVQDLELSVTGAPPIYDYARGGYRFTSGFWSGWMVRTHSDNCVGSPCVRFIDRGGYGAMRDHTQGVRYLGTSYASSGQVDLKVRFHGSQLTSTGAGRHLLSITSRPLIFTPRDVGLATWTRVDLDRPSPGRVRAVIFNTVNGVRINDGRWPTRTFDVPFATDRWAALTIGWQMSGNRLTLRVNGQSATFTLLPGSEAPGVYLGLGNMDPISGEIDFDDIRAARLKTGDPGNLEEHLAE